MRTAVASVLTAAVAVVVLSSLGGCNVSTHKREPASTKVQDVLDSGQGQFDLTRPPSREEAGMPAGRTNVTYQRGDHTPFHVRVALPEGKELAVDARLVTFDALAELDPATAPPTTLDIHHYAASLEAGRDHIMAAAGRFGLDTGLIQKWYDEAKSPRPVKAPPVVETPWLQSRLGYLRIDVRARYWPPADTAQSQQTVVHYLLTWTAGPRPTPS